jgi:hypothetical protein
MMKVFWGNMYHGELFSLFVLLLFIIAAYGAGYIFNRFVLKMGWRQDFAGIVIGIVLGLNILAFITLIFGVCGWLNSISCWLILAIPAVSGIIIGGKVVIKAKFAFIRKNMIFSAILAIIAFFTLGSALCFPYAWDELTYHIALPFRWIETGTLKVFTDNPFSGLPDLPQLLFRLGCEIGGILFPRLLVWAAYILLLTEIYIYFKPLGRRLLSLVLAFLFIANPLVINMMRSTYVEVFMMLDMLAALLLLRNTTSKSWQVILLSGLLAGGAVAVKLTGLGTAMVIFIFLLHKYWRHSKLKPFHIILFFVIGGIIMSLPFYLRPWFSTGNPFYPFFASWFGGTEAEVLTSKYHYLLGDAHFGLRTIQGFFTVLIMVAFAGKAFDGMILGWVFIALLLLAIWWIRNLFSGPALVRRSKLYLPASMIFYYCFWFASSQQTRFIMPLLFLVLLAAFYCIRSLDRKWQNTIVTILLLVWLGGFFYPPAYEGETGSYSWLAVRHFELSWRNAGKFPEQAENFLKYATNDPGFIETMVALEKKTTPGSKVMFLYERRGLYCSRPYVIGTPYWQAGFNTPPAKNDRDFYNSLHENKIKYLVIGGSRKNPDELGGKYLLEKERFMVQVNRLVKQGKLLIVWGQENFFLCKVQ